MAVTREKLQTIINQLNDVMAELPSESPVGPLVFTTLPSQPSAPESPATPQAAPEKAPTNQWLSIRQALGKANEELAKLPADNQLVKNVKTALENIEKYLNAGMPPYMLKRTIKQESTNANGYASALVDEGLDPVELMRHINEIRTLTAGDDANVIEGGTEVGIDVTK